MPGEIEHMHHSTPRKKSQVPLDDARDGVIPDALRILREIGRNPHGLVYSLHSGNMSAVLAALHASGLVVLIQNHPDILVKRRELR